MTNTPDLLPLASQSSAPKQNPLALAILLALGTIIFIWSEIWLFSSILYWALTGVLHAGGLYAIVLGVIIFAPTLWVSWIIARLAIEAERNPDIEQAVAEE